ncbi:hypothetical protein XaC1_546 [Xanthomonas phage XaC1]|nr:hypothetical protein XaC1_546 [Xanthomonas phage XaC1]
MELHDVNNSIQEKLNEIESLQGLIAKTHEEGEPIRAEMSKSKDQGRINKLENKLNMLFSRRLNLIYQVQACKEQIVKYRNDYMSAVLL